MHMDAFTCSLAFQTIFCLLMFLQGATGRNCLTLPCPTQGLPLSKGVRWPAGSSISCLALFPVLYLSSTQYFFFFARFKILSGFALTGGWHQATGEFTRGKSLQREMSQG